MSYSVRLRKAAATLYTFATNPFVDPEHSYEFYDGVAPPRLAAVNKAWTLDGILNGNETQVNAAWTALVAVLENQGSYPDAVQLLQGAAVVESIDSGNGYELFKIEKISAPRIEGGWHDQMRFTIRITAKKRFPVGAIVNLSLSDSFSYDEAGLLTRTLDGEIETANGTSAQVTALGQAITLPGADYGWETNGPSGMNVAKLNVLDTKAHFTSTYRQNGVTLPAGVGPSYEKTIATTIDQGETSTTTTVSAVGTGAESAVRAQAPVGQVKSTVISVSSSKRSAHATYVQKTFTGGSLLTRHSLTSTGGGNPIRFTERTGGRDPAMHVLARTPVRITEEARVEIHGSPRPEEFELPPLLTGAGIVEDLDALKVTAPERVEFGSDLAGTGDKWAATTHREYWSATAVSLPTILNSSIQRGSGVKLTDELARAGGGASGSSLFTNGGGLGIEGFTPPSAGGGGGQIRAGIL